MSPGLSNGLATAGDVFIDVAIVAVGVAIIFVFGWHVKVSDWLKHRRAKKLWGHHYGRR